MPTLPPAPHDEAVTALIPHRPPFLFVDRILRADADSLLAERTWRAEEDFYRGHYPAAPITPGVLLCEAVFQTGALFMAKRAEAATSQAGQQAGEGSDAAAAPPAANGVPLLAKIGDVRFRSPIFPGDTVHIEVRRKETLGGFTMMDGAVRKADGTRVLNVSFAVAWKMPEAASPGNALSTTATSNAATANAAPASDATATGGLRK